MSLAPNMDFRLNEHPRWNTNCFQIEVYENVTHHVKSKHFSSCVPLAGSDVRTIIARILTTLESGLVPSFPNIIHRISVSELMASIPSERDYELRKKHQLSMNCSICFSVLIIFMSYQKSEISHVSVTEFIGHDVFPFPFKNRNVIV